MGFVPPPWVVWPVTPLLRRGGICTEGARGRQSHSSASIQSVKEDEPYDAPEPGPGQAAQPRVLTPNPVRPRPGDGTGNERGSGVQETSRTSTDPGKCAGAGEANIKAAAEPRGSFQPNWHWSRGHSSRDMVRGFWTDHTYWVLPMIRLGIRAGSWQATGGPPRQGL